jgi:hypothetical protein
LNSRAYCDGCRAVTVSVSGREHEQVASLLLPYAASTSTNICIKRIWFIFVQNAKYSVLDLRSTFVVCPRALDLVLPERNAQSLCLPHCLGTTPPPHRRKPDPLLHVMSPQRCNRAGWCSAGDDAGRSRSRVGAIAGRQSVGEAEQAALEGGGSTEGQSEDGTVAVWQSEGAAGRSPQAGSCEREGQNRYRASDTDEHRARLKSGAFWAVGLNSTWILLSYMGYD